jgi:hypothetical protein
MTTGILTGRFSGDTRAATKNRIEDKDLNHKERIEHKANFLFDLCALCGKNVLPASTRFTSVGGSAVAA